MQSLRSSSSYSVGGSRSSKILFAFVKLYVMLNSVDYRVKWNLKCKMNAKWDELFLIVSFSIHHYNVADCRNAHILTTQTFDICLL